MSFLTSRMKVLLSMWLISLVACQQDRIDYNTQVKPILNKKCLRCHGGVRQNGGFSLLTRDQALAATESGQPAIIPGHASKSEMMKRILSDDPEIRMPMDGDPLSQKEIQILSDWIDQDLPWNLHWSYKPVAEVLPPKSPLLGSMIELKEPHPIDLFVLEEMEKLGFDAHSKPADKTILLRRAALDLIGMPAPQELKDRFLASEKEDAFEKLVDELMALPQFGERWASMWLDLARYADSKGYERDPHRNIWRYRDWVIRAFNKDMPYDQFITEQLAGDMLQNPTDDQLIATGFHRNTTTNDEGGTDNEEYRTYSVFDRVNTTYEALMATTMACVQCHSHPYDPFLHIEYYQSMGFFNNTRDADTHADYPLLRHFDSTDNRKLDGLVDWLGQHLEDEEVRGIEQFIKTWQPAWHSIETDSFQNSALYDMKYLGLRQNGSCRLPKIDLTDKSNLFVRYRTNRKDGRWSLKLGSRTGEELLSVILPETGGAWKIHRFDLPSFSGMHDLFLTYQSPTVSKNDDRPQATFDWLRFDGYPLPWQKSEGQKHRKIFWELLEKPITATPIMTENPADMVRVTHRFDRGNFMVKEESVQPGIPAVFGTWPASLPKNRLGLAKWIMDENHPLTARTWVNRIWAQLFGNGLVETLEDFGSQGSYPSHPALLDWLAWKMMHTHDWSLKKFLKMIMLSETYQQQSSATSKMLEIDPDNRYFLRGPRVRLSAEQIRDQALAVAGLLNDEMGGPSVMPYQPVQWNIPYSSERWKTSTDGQQYRRGIYTYWKRSSPYPAMMIFDAAERGVCEARRIQTNTPLHALVTLNDPVYVEAAAHFGKYMFEAGSNVQAQLMAGYEKMFDQKIPDETSAIFTQLFEKSVLAFKTGNSEAEPLLQYLNQENNIELAAMVMVANAMMNMDAFVMKN